MFYSSETNIVSTWASHIEFDRVFCGQYWDEFACVGFLGSPEKNYISVLMLGLAEGGAIRPVLSTGRIAEFIGLDSDAASVERCKALHCEHFPELLFETVIQDATEYLKNHHRKFDVIVVDLYTAQKYSPVVFENEFHNLLKERLETRGNIVFNSYGLPIHLAPFRGHSPQRLLAKVLNNNWSHVSYLPYRRNVTFIVGFGWQGSTETTLLADNLKSLKLSDRLYLQVLAERMDCLQAAPISCFPDNHSCTTYKVIDVEMRRRWMKLIPLFAKKIPTKITLKQPSDFRLLLSDPELCRRIQTSLTASGDPLCILLPILVAGEMNCSEIDAGWLADWAIDELKSVDGSRSNLFLQYSLTQALAVIINGGNRYRSKLFRFADAVQQRKNGVLLG